MVYQQVRVRIWITHTVAQETPLLMGDQQVCRVSHPLLSSDKKRVSRVLFIFWNWQ